MKEYILARAEKMRGAMSEQGCDAFVIMTDESTNWESLFYMSGFRGTSGALVIYPDSAELILDSRYAEQGRAQSPHRLLEQKTGLIEDIAASLACHNVANVMCESDKTFHSSWAKLSSCGVTITDGTPLMKELRRTKDASEISSVRRAGDIGTEAFLETLNHVKDGMSEKEFESLLNYNINILGGECGFDMIVASGTRSSMPHGRATDKKMRNGEWVTVDYGARFNGYFCDITRNFSIGAPDDKAASYHETVLEAHRTSAEKIRAGLCGTDIHNTALAVLEKKGLGKYFTHGLGHGFGLEIHEAPYLSPRRKSVLQAGDIVTVEPGIYIEGWGGLRIEDDYLVAENSAQRLTDKLNQCFYRA